MAGILDGRLKNELVELIPKAHLAATPHSPLVPEGTEGCFKPYFAPLAFSC